MGSPFFLPFKFPSQTIEFHTVCKWQTKFHISLNTLGIISFSRHFLSVSLHVIISFRQLTQTQETQGKREKCETEVVCWSLPSSLVLLIDTDSRVTTTTTTTATTAAAAGKPASSHSLLLFSYSHHTVLSLFRLQPLAPLIAIPLLLLLLFTHVHMDPSPPSELL